MELYQIALLCIGALLLIAAVIAWVNNKDLLKISKIFSPIVSSLYLTIKAVGNAMPHNSILKTIVIVLEAAITATRLAEQMWLDGNIDKEQRNVYAKNYISEVLEEAGIPVTEVIEDIIDGAIALTCALLPHGVNKE